MAGCCSLAKRSALQCHSDATLDSVKQTTHGKETFTMYCYANIGVPRNPANPFYVNTNRDSNPQGCNPLGADFIDYGLGANPNPAPDGTRFMDATRPATSHSSMECSKRPAFATWTSVRIPAS